MLFFYLLTWILLLCVITSAINYNNVKNNTHIALRILCLFTILFVISFITTLFVFYHPT